MFISLLLFVGALRRVCAHDCPCYDRLSVRVPVFLASPADDVVPLLSQDLLRSCLDQIEEMCRQFAQEQASRGATGATPIDRALKHNKAETPTDVREVHF